MNKDKDNDIELDDEIENEPAPSFLDEMRSIGNFFKKLFGKSDKHFIENESGNPVEEKRTDNQFKENKPDEGFKDIKTDNADEENVSEKSVEESRVDKSSEEGSTDNSFEEGRIDSSSEENRLDKPTKDTVIIESASKTNLEEVETSRGLNEEPNDEDEIEDEDDDEAAPSFKDELSAIVNFFKSPFKKKGKQSKKQDRDESSHSEQQEFISKPLIDEEPDDEDEIDDEIDGEDEDAPSFKDELRAIVNFFKNPFKKKGKKSTKQKKNRSKRSEPLTDEGHSDSTIKTEIEEDLLSDEDSIGFFERRKKKWFTRKKKPEPTAEQIQEKRLKFYKGLTSTFLFLLVFFTIGIFGFTSTSKKEFCVSCHEMRPEHYTLMASSHSDVECVDCHTNPGLEEMFMEKARTAGMFIRKATNKTETTIVLKTQVDDAACNKCHNMKKRSVTHAGDWIIPHDKHAKNDIGCVECHAGVAHGQIASRNLTQQKNLDQWNEVVGKSMMSDEKYTKLTMDDCMNCHLAREAPTKCDACHSSGMIPETHKQPNFIEGIHGTDARKDIQKCHKCHAYNTPDPIEVVQETGMNKNGVIKKATGSSVMAVENYILENKFCRDCHHKRPKSHDGDFFKRHGSVASQNERKCYSCHPANQTKTKRNAVVMTTCRTCHPAKHAKNLTIYKSHPIPLKPGDKIQESCFRCHGREGCAKCHKDFRVDDSEGKTVAP